MAPMPVAVVNAGLVTSVGLSAPAACAAIRAGISNHTETRFTDSVGNWTLGAQVLLNRPWGGRARLAIMAQMAIEECVAPYPALEPAALPLILCLAEAGRPGRLDGLDEELFGEIERGLHAEFDPALSAVIAEGRVGPVLALAHARRLIYERNVPAVLIAATDSLLRAPTLADFDANRRLLTEQNSNGFVPGEAAGAVLVARDPIGPGCVTCEGVGFGVEPATVLSEEPSRADGLTQAVKAALADAGCELHDLNFRLADVSGEQYYFKEAALGLNRVMRVRREAFDLWHPADCVGETGAAIGLITLAVALAACRKQYAPGPRVLLHCGNDAGRRGAVILRCGRDG